jgi:phosphoribosylamine-glycine ligase
VRIVVVTQDFSGLGFAMRLADEGNEVLLATSRANGDASPEWERVGCGLVAKEPLASVMARRAELRDALFVWDQNHTVEENETLRAERFRVLFGGAHAWRMEHDRAAALDFVSAYGLKAPPSFRFENPADALAFAAERSETAFVMKPDEGAKHETFVPESEEAADANEELRLHLEACGPKGSFVLQERLSGVETNVEVWFVEGEPRFAFMTLECKKKYVLDLGPLVGCALDFAFTIPLDSRAVAESVGKLFPAYREMRYTGIGDANVIADRDGVWFLEKCERLGYNAHPNLLFNLARGPIGEVFASLVDGSFAPDFAEGFGASVTMSTMENAPGGMAILIPPRHARDVYLWDAWKAPRGHLVTAGYDAAGDVLLVTGHGFTIPTAWEAVAKRASEIRFPYRHWRSDGDGTNFPSSPIRRWEALKAMGYI